jgi:hypothetical protein
MTMHMVSQTLSLSASIHEHDVNSIGAGVVTPAPTVNMHMVFETLSLSASTPEQAMNFWGGRHWQPCLLLSSQRLCYPCICISLVKPAIQASRVISAHNAICTARHKQGNL